MFLPVKTDIGLVIQCLDISFNRFLRIEDVELPKEQAELLFKRFQYRALFQFR